MIQDCCESGLVIQSCFGLMVSCWDDGETLESSNLSGSIRCSRRRFLFLNQRDVLSVRKGCKSFRGLEWPKLPILATAMRIVLCIVTIQPPFHSEEEMAFRFGILDHFFVWKDCLPFQCSMSRHYSLPVWTPHLLLSVSVFVHVYMSVCMCVYKTCTVLAVTS